MSKQIDTIDGHKIDTIVDGQLTKLDAYNGIAVFMPSDLADQMMQGAHRNYGGNRKLARNELKKAFRKIGREVRSYVEGQGDVLPSSDVTLLVFPITPQPPSALHPQGLVMMMVTMAVGGENRLCFTWSEDCKLTFVGVPTDDAPVCLSQLKRTPLH